MHFGSNNITWPVNFLSINSCLLFFGNRLRFPWYFSLNKKASFSLLLFIDMERALFVNLLKGIPLLILPRGASIKQVLDLKATKGAICHFSFVEILLMDNGLFKKYQNSNGTEKMRDKRKRYLIGVKRPANKLFMLTQ